MTHSLPPFMRAAMCHGPGHDLVIESRTCPAPGPGQILVKLETCGVCHSDLHLREGDENLLHETYPHVFGHEGIGRVVALGPGTGKRTRIGQRVGLPWLYGTCLQCRPCLNGSETFCASQSARGVHQAGAFAEYALADERFSPHIPDQIDAVTGAPLLCAGLTAWSALGRTRLRAGGSVLVIGIGGLGQYAILIARARGARVFAVDTHAGKRERATALGAEIALKPGSEAIEAIRHAGGADVTLNFAPSESIWPLIEATANPMSDIVAVALVHQPVPLSMMWLIDGGHHLMGSSVGTRVELDDLLSFATQHSLPVPVEAIALEQVNQALDRLKAETVEGRLCIDFSLPFPD